MRAFLASEFILNKTPGMSLDKLLREEYNGYAVSSSPPAWGENIREIARGINKSWRPTAGSSEEAERLGEEWHEIGMSCLYDSRSPSDFLSSPETPSDISRFFKTHISEFSASEKFGGAAFLLLLGALWYMYS